MAIAATAITNVIMRMTGDNKDLLKAIGGTVAAMVTLNRVMKKFIDLTLEAGRAASVLEEIQQKFNVVFRTNRQEMNAWTEDFALSIRRNSTAIKGFLAQLQDTFVPIGFAREKASELSRELVKLAFDLSSFNDIAASQVISDLKSALLGNVRAVRKYGIAATETAIQQEALNRGWIRHKDEINAVIKANSIHNIILKSTRDAQGDLQRTIEQTANVERQLQDAIRTSKELYGVYVNEALTPVKRAFAVLITAVNETIKAKRNLDDALSEEPSQRVDTEAAIELQEEIIAKYERQKEVFESMADSHRKRLAEQEQGNLRRLELAREELKILEERRQAEIDLEEDIKRATGYEQLKLKVTQERLSAELELSDQNEETIRAQDELIRQFGIIEQQERLAAEAGEEFSSAKERMTVAQELINDLLEKGISLDHIGIQLLKEEFILNAQLYQAELVAAKDKEETDKKEIERIKEKLKLYKEGQETVAENIKQYQDWQEKSKSLFEIIATGLTVTVEEAQETANRISTIVSGISSLINQIGSMFSALASLQNARTSSAIEALEIERDKHLESAEDRILIESELKEEQAQINEEYADKIAEIEYEGALKAWRFQVASATAMMAQGILNALTIQPVYLVPAAIALATAVGGINVAAVRASKPQKGFQTGVSNFTVPEGFEDDSFQIGLTSGENVSVATPTQQADNALSGRMNVYVMMDRKILASATNLSIENREIEIHVGDLLE